MDTFKRWLTERWEAHQSDFLPSLKYPRYVKIPSIRQGRHWNHVRLRLQNRGKKLFKYVIRINEHNLVT